MKQQLATGIDTEDEASFERRFHELLAMCTVSPLTVESIRSMNNTWRDLSVQLLLAHYVAIDMATKQKKGASIH